MKKILTVLLGLSLFGCGSKSSYNQIDGHTALEMINRESDYLIIDVRTVAEYQQSHIKDAINIPNETIDESVETILTDKDQLLLIYCRSGNRSKQASEKLAKLGYTNIYEFGAISDFPGEIVNE
ncbi:MAG: rhodanese-like domain-containing protein [Erysipelotrichaceae bacterium]